MTLVHAHLWNQHVPISICMNLIRNENIVSTKYHVYLLQLNFHKPGLLIHMLTIGLHILFSPTIGPHIVFLALNSSIDITTANGFSLFTDYVQRQLGNVEQIISNLCQKFTKTKGDNQCF